VDCSNKSVDRDEEEITGDSRASGRFGCFTGTQRVVSTRDKGDAGGGWHKLRRPGDPDPSCAGAMEEKLLDMGVDTVEIFIWSGLELNKALERSENRRLHKVTLATMMQEACALGWFGAPKDDVTSGAPKKDWLAPNMY
jgi:hypothetical protein